MEFVDVPYYQGADETYLRLRENGAFLASQSRRGERNVMTIGWGTIGVIWRLPIFIVLVRPSRHTQALIEDKGEFTVNVPFEGKMLNELNICGTRSGRDMDKFSDLGLSTAPGKTVGVPVLTGCKWIYECRVVYKQAMEPANVAPGIIKCYYEKGDFHTVYYGEILSSYMNNAG